MVPIYAEHWGRNSQFYPNFAPCLTFGGMKLNHYRFHVSISSEDQKKGLHGKFEEFLSPKSSKDQKKRSSPKIEEFLSPKASKDQKSTSAQMQIVGQLLGRYAVKLLGEIYPRIPLGFRHSCIKV